MGDDRKREVVVRRIQSLLSHGSSPKSIIDRILQEGTTLPVIKKAVAFLPLEQHRAFAKVLSRHPHHSAAHHEMHAVKREMHHTESTERRTEESKATGSSFFNRIQLLVVVGSLLMFFLWLQLTTEASMFIILVGFLPTLIIISLAVLLMEKHGEHYLPYLWLVLIFIIVLFYFILEGASNPIADELDLGEVSALNFFVSAVFLLILNTTWIRSRKYHRQLRRINQADDAILEENAELHAKAHATESRLLSLEEYVHSIEDKCKAINFVVGRVYKDRNGGSAKMRNLVKIDPAWYNEFSTIKSFRSPEDQEILKELIGNIQIRLSLMGKTENRVFGNLAEGLKGLKRDVSGRDRVIEVLANNDKDPIKTYYESALTFCRNVLVELGD